MLTSLRSVDTAVAIVVGVAAASYATLRAARAHWRIEPLLPTSWGRFFPLALVWLVVFSTAFLAIYWPYAQFWAPS